MQGFSSLTRLGLNPKELRKSYKEIQRYNLTMLRNFAVATVPLLLMCQIVSMILHLNSHSGVALVSFMLAAVCFAIISHCMLKSEAFTGATVYALASGYGFVVYLETIYIGVFANRDEVGTLFMLFLIASQVLYVMPLSWNFIMSVMPTVAYIVSAVLVKAPEVYIQDIRNSIIALTIGLCLNFINSREKAQLIVGNYQLSREYTALSETSSVDSLTGLFNKAVSQEKLAEFCDECAEEKSSIFAAIVDVDFFKKYNDTYGHLKGDEILNRLGTMMNNLAREYHIVAGRVGGEEFLLTGHAGSRLQATRICDKLRYEVQRCRIEHSTSDAAPFVTISVGVAFAEIGTVVDAEELYERADEALYEAKRAGRNCVKTNM